MKDKIEGQDDADAKVHKGTADADAQKRWVIACLNEYIEAGNTLFNAGYLERSPRSWAGIELTQVGFKKLSKLFNLEVRTIREWGGERQGEHVNVSLAQIGGKYQIFCINYVFQKPFKSEPDLQGEMK